jgi:hypothetical protein
MASKLTLGRIPPATVCPFRDKCKIKAEGTCKHKGLEHTCPFSCAAARFFDQCHEEIEAE